MNSKNKCVYCGGNLLIEYIGSYGLVYSMKKNGQPSKNPLRRILYEASAHDDDTLIYCSKCFKSQEKSIAYYQSEE